MAAQPVSHSDRIERSPHREDAGHHFAFRVVWYGQSPVRASSRLLWRCSKAIRDRATPSLEALTILGGTWESLRLLLNPRQSILSRNKWKRVQRRSRQLVPQ